MPPKQIHEYHTSIQHLLNYLFTVIQQLVIPSHTNSQLNIIYGPVTEAHEICSFGKALVVPRNFRAKMSHRPARGDNATLAILIALQHNSHWNSAVYQHLSSVLK